MGTASVPFRWPRCRCESSEASAAISGRCATLLSLPCGCSVKREEIGIAREDNMTAMSPQSAETKVNNRWFQFSKRRILILLGLAVVLFAVYVVFSSSSFSEYRRSWTEDYDSERYTQIHKVIDSDPEHLLGKPFDEVSKELNLDKVPWDDVSLQEGPESRMYHFRGFYFWLHVEPLPLGVTPQNWKLYSSSDLERGRVLWLDMQRPFVRIDGIRDQKERMEQWRKGVEEEGRRITEEMRQRRNSGGLSDTNHL